MEDAIAGAEAELARVTDLNRWKISQMRAKYAERAQGFLLGQTRRIGRYHLSDCKHNTLFPRLHHYLDQIAKVNDFEYTTIQVNRSTADSPVKWHRDASNGGKVTAVMSFGDFTGGELRVENVEEPFSIFHTFYVFDAANVYHAPLPHSGGERYSAVWFTTVRNKSGCRCRTLKCLNDCKGNSLAVPQPPLESLPAPD